jgi:hypothetical protein
MIIEDKNDGQYISHIKIKIIHAKLFHNLILFYGMGHILKMKIIHLLTFILLSEIGILGEQKRLLRN